MPFSGTMEPMDEILDLRPSFKNMKIRESFDYGLFESLLLEKVYTI